MQEYSDLEGEDELAGDVPMSALIRLPEELQDALKEQWRLVEASDAVKAAGELIIESLDEKGYLTVRLEQLCQNDKQSFSIEHPDEAIQLVQQLEPPGVGARDARECLLIQKRQFPEDMISETETVPKHRQELPVNRPP